MKWSPRSAYSSTVAARPGRDDHSSSGHKARTPRKLSGLVRDFPTTLPALRLAATPVAHRPGPVMAGSASVFVGESERPELASSATARGPPVDIPAGQVSCGAEGTSNPHHHHTGQGAGTDRVGRHPGRSRRRSAGRLPGCFARPPAGSRPLPTVASDQATRSNTARHEAPPAFLAIVPEIPRSLLPPYG